MITYTVYAIDSTFFYQISFSDAVSLLPDSSYKGTVCILHDDGSESLIETWGDLRSQFGNYSDISQLTYVVPIEHVNNQIDLFFIDN